MRRILFSIEDWCLEVSGAAETKLKASVLMALSELAARIGDELNAIRRQF